MTKFLIWSIEHRGWWKPNCHGYTTRTDKAGQFSYDEARNIVCAANEYCLEGEFEEFMVIAPSAEQISLDLEYPDR